MTTTDFCDLHEMANCHHDPPATANRGSVRATSDLEYSKQELLDMIAYECGGFKRRYHATEGSSLPRPFFEELAQWAKLTYSRVDSMPKIAQMVIEACGHTFYPHYVSRGSTVTKPGLYGIYLAVKDPVEEDEPEESK